MIDLKYKFFKAPDEAAGDEDKSSNFIKTLIDQDIAEGGEYEGMTVHTRFPPEPNGYLHIGHAKAICIDFGMAEEYGGICNLRMDDTNPVAEDEEFVEAIKEDIKWLGFDWDDRFFYASDYFEKMYECAVTLIKKGLAYVCELSADEIRANRGTLKTPGVESPYRNRPIEESLDLFERMKAGEFADGSMTLRAKIDMSSGNMNMRDPVIYRIAHIKHHRQGDKWKIYPMYDFAHPIEDALEHITHSLCSLEFEDHRPLYNWVRDNCDLPSKPRQIEFARLNIEGYVMSKRHLRRLVEEGKVSGWDDPGMPTLRGLRRRGFPPQAIRNFCDKIGVSKVDSVVESSFLDYNVREVLDSTAPRAMAVINPLKLVINNYPEDKIEKMEASNHPKDPEMGSHTVEFSKNLYIDQKDFAIDPPSKYHRFKVGAKVRLRSAYILECTGYDQDENGNVTCIYCDYDPETRGGKAREGEKIRGTIHWVSQHDAVPAEIRHFEALYVENPAFKQDGETDASAMMNDESETADTASAADSNSASNATTQEEEPMIFNEDSLEIIENAMLEPWIIEQCKADADTRFQFMREAYYIIDSKLSSDEKPVFNRIVSLKDSFGKGGKTR